MPEWIRLLLLSFIIQSGIFLFIGFIYNITKLNIERKKITKLKKFPLSFTIYVLSVILPYVIIKENTTYEGFHFVYVFIGVSVIYNSSTISWLTIVLSDWLNKRINEVNEEERDHI